MTSSGMPSAFSSLFNQTLPPEGPRMIPFNVDFAAELEATVDLTQLINLNWVSFVSGLWFDNSANAQPVTLVCAGSNQSIIIPASKQGWFPIHATNPPVFTLSVSSAGDICRLQFVNYPVWPYVIGDGGGGGGGDTDVNIAEIGGVAVPGSSLPVEIASPTLTDYSAALTGGSDEYIAAGDALKYLAIYNPLANAPITVNLAGGDATASGVVLNGGGSLTVDQGLANAVTIAGTITQIVNVFGGV